KKEFDNIEGDIEALTAQKSAIEAKFLDTTLSVEEINELSAKLQEINQKIDQKEGRWFELSSMLED
ncbi:MAG: ABC transporter C-terminal domain-containing protein, partial [Lutibacter sp.]|nr:ABC transporter C-terminal domain-containing protein [Lutibacter sp.]